MHVYTACPAIFTITCRQRRVAALENVRFGLENSSTLELRINHNVHWNVHNPGMSCYLFGHNLPSLWSHEAFTEIPREWQT